jgi:Mrp family chromosome partitioning ATPase
LLGVAAPGPEKEKSATDVGTTQETLAEYKDVSSRLAALRNKEFELLGTMTDENPLVIRVRSQIGEYEKRKKALEADHPKLAMFNVPQRSSPLTPDPRSDPLRAAALESKIRVLTNQLALVRNDISLLDNLETSILDVQRKLQLDQQNYLHIAAGIESARIDDALGSGKISNIQPVQNPSPPALNVSQRLKLVAGTFFGLLIAGLAIAFLIEFFVDHTVRRPLEFESKLQMPLFLSIPKFGLNGHAKLLPLPSYSAHPATEPDAGGDLKHTWAADHPLRPYIDGLRDRTLIHFEGDSHKPKLVAITSCSPDAGVTSLAAGLAGALSETGDGNVLLMNLNFDAQSVHPFYRGELACGLADALEIDKRRNSPVLQNLYVATAGGSGDTEPQNLSKQLARVVPKLRVSDYDYIIFDLPPTTPTTMSARLAGMMDLVILVVQSEKDTQETVKQAAKLLARSKARVSAVLNKVRNPVPNWLR